MYRIGDFLIQIKNAYRAHKQKLEYPHSNVVEALGKILEKEGRIGKLKIKSEPFDKTQDKKLKVGSDRKILEIELKYEDRRPAINDIKLFSKPSVHRYVENNDLKKSLRSYGISIISTSSGMMTGREASKKGIGGELICQIS